MLVLTMAFVMQVGAQTKYDNKNKDGYAIIDDKRTTMTSDQQTMLNEINLVRKNPSGYVAYVQAFAQEKTKGMDATAAANYMKTVNELIAELNGMKALSELKFSDCIYKAAQAHAMDQGKARTSSYNPINHNNEAGKQPHERIGAVCTDFPAWYKRPDGYSAWNGGENLEWDILTSYRKIDPRRSNINLLVDYGEPSRGHRKAILNPRYTHAAPFNYTAKFANGTTEFNIWIQNYGTEEKPNTASSGSSTSGSTAVPKVLPQGCPTSIYQVKMWPPAERTLNNKLIGTETDKYSEECWKYWESKGF